MSLENAITHQPVSEEELARRLGGAGESSRRVINEQHETIRAQYIALNDARDCIAGVLEELVTGRDDFALLKLRDYLRSVGL